MCILIKIEIKPNIFLFRSELYVISPVVSYVFSTNGNAVSHCTRAE